MLGKIRGFEETDNPDGIYGECKFYIIDKKDSPLNIEKHIFLK